MQSILSPEISQMKITRMPFCEQLRQVCWTYTDLLHCYIRHGSGGNKTKTISNDGFQTKLFWDNYGSFRVLCSLPTVLTEICNGKNLMQEISDTIKFSLIKYHRGYQTSGIASPRVRLPGKTDIPFCMTKCFSVKSTKMLK